MPPFMDLVRGWRWTIRCARSDGKAVEALTSLSPVLDPPYAAEEQAGLGRAAYRDFGKDREHPAQLNFGDCFWPGQLASLCCSRGATSPIPTSARDDYDEVTIRSES